MTTDELIVELARSAGPVTRLPAPSVRFVQWIALAMLVAIAAVMAIGPRVDLQEAAGRPAFVVSLLALLIATVSGGAVALISSVPGAERSPRLRVLPIAALMAWA